VADGWAAWHWLDGEPWTATVAAVLDVSARFHDAVAGVPWGPAMVGNDRWAVADRIAWGEVDDTIPASLAHLANARRPVPLASQFIHGDLCGNVLTHPDLPPAVIDISPYWRPAAYAAAIALVDLEAPQVLCRIFLSWKDVHRAEEDRSEGQGALCAAGA
jgi:Ser/Thr protein kinase RdoA (MazF antagonist)